jgi:hypothetical protein
VPEVRLIFSNPKGEIFMRLLSRALIIGAVTALAGGFALTGAATSASAHGYHFKKHYYGYYHHKGFYKPYYKPYFFKKKFH